MTKQRRPLQAAGGSQQVAERIGQPIAAEMNLEWVEVTFQKESRGSCLCIYLDKEGGLTLDDCERFHKRIQPLLEDIAYDFLEVSSPGIDRPIKTERDFEKNRGALVEVKLYAPQEGSKLHRGYLQALDAKSVTLAPEAGGKPLPGDGRDPDHGESVARPTITFARSAVALVRPVIELEDEEE